MLTALMLSPGVDARQDPQRQQPQAPQRERGGRQRPAEPPPPDFSPIIAAGVAHILSGQEGETQSEWPYEGVYRVNRQIPVGYRVGGTAICATALIRAPGYADDRARKDAVHRGVKFIINGCEHPLMSPIYDGGYDVRGWGYTYGLAFLLELKQREIVPEELADEVDKTIRWFIEAIFTTEINEVGGWNYARQAGREAVSPPSPFMTAPTLVALFEARKQGYEVNADAIDRALKTLEAARTASGSLVYSGVRGANSSEPTPGAVGRMLAAETTLLLAGRSSVQSVRGALDAFIVHWDWLEQRRAKTGTHEGPYGVAPYYFYFAHYYAAMAVEMLPQRERSEYRRRINDLLMKTRREDGSWNDRVFERTSNYSTAMSLMAIMMPETPPPAKWGQSPASE